MAAFYDNDSELERRDHAESIHHENHISFEQVFFRFIPGYRFCSKLCRYRRYPPRGYPVMLRKTTVRARFRQEHSTKKDPQAKTVVEKIPSQKQTTKNSVILWAISRVNRRTDGGNWSLNKEEKKQSVSSDFKRQEKAILQGVGAKEPETLRGDYPDKTWEWKTQNSVPKWYLTPGFKDTIWDF